MNYMNEPVFIEIMADWMAKEFPDIHYEHKSAWWVIFRHSRIAGRSPVRELVAWIGYDKAFNVGTGGSTASIFDPHSPTFFEDCKAAINIRLQEAREA